MSNSKIHISISRSAANLFPETKSPAIVLRCVSVRAGEHLGKRFVNFKQPGVTEIICQLCFVVANTIVGIVVVGGQCAGE